MTTALQARLTRALTPYAFALLTHPTVDAAHRRMRAAADLRPVRAARDGWEALRENPRVKALNLPAHIRAADPSRIDVQARLAAALRIGLGLLFIIGGWAKLSRLLSPSEAGGIVAEYTGPLGYINQTFLEWLFEGPLGIVLSPWSFLTLLSAFELVAGAMLVIGVLIRPLALIWAGLLWTFVVSLPVVTTPGETLDAMTYSSPAMFVQIRDIALSGCFVVLFNLGAGAWSWDSARRGAPMALGRDWDALGLVLRWSLGVMFLVGGLFHGFHKVPTFDAPAVLLVAVGAALVVGWRVRLFAAVATAVLAVYMLGKLVDATSLLGFLNAVKREIGLIAGTAALAKVGGGAQFSVDHLRESQIRPPRLTTSAPGAEALATSAR